MNYVFWLPFLRREFLSEISLTALQIGIIIVIQMTIAVQEFVIWGIQIIGSMEFVNPKIQPFKTIAFLNGAINVQNP